MILKNPGATPQDSTGKYDFLDNESIVSNYWNFKKIQPQLFHFFYSL
jgi:hypothetical protein